MVRSDSEQGDLKAPHRKIIHIDMDAFYASVGIIRTCAESRSLWAARQSAVSWRPRATKPQIWGSLCMPSVTAKRMPRPDLRQATLRGLQGDQPANPRDLRRAHNDHRASVARRGLLDVTENLQDIPLARDIALRIREKIKAETGLNASAGISYNKFLAKLASDHRKPNRQFVILPEMGPPLWSRFL